MTADMTMTRRGFARLIATLPFLSTARAEEGWSAIEAEARGQTGYFNDETRERALKALDACGLKRPS